MIKLIVNADDFGRNKTCTQAILEFMEEGLVSNTTLMVTESYAEDAMNIARQKGFVDKIGLHLNLTEGCPLTEDIKQCPLFCGTDGRFNGLFHSSLKTRLFLPRKEQYAVEKEIQAQLERYRELGGVEFHLDSHHHAHTDYAVTRILFPIAKRSGFRTCRLSLDIAGGALKTLYKRAFNAYTKTQFITTHAFVAPEAVLSNPDKWDGEIIEIMTHPIRCMNGAIDAADLVDQGVLENETKVECLKSFIDQLSGRIRLISYGEL